MKFHVNILNTYSSHTQEHLCILELELEQGLEPKPEGLQIELVQIYDFLIFCISMRHVILKVPKRSLPGHKPHVFGQRLEIESDHPGFLTSEQPCFTFH